MLGDDRVALRLVNGGERADPQRFSLVADAAQLPEPAHVHEQVGEGEPQPQQWQQALPAGDHLGVLAAVGQGADRLVQRPGPGVVELRRDHCPPPFCPVPVSRAAWMARQTCSGVQGIGTSLIPIGRSVSGSR